MFERNVDAELHILDGPTTDLSGIDVRRYTPNKYATKLFFSREMRNGISEAAERCDVLHSHGLWSANSFYCDWAARRQKRSHILSVHGTLSPLAFSKSRLKKQLLWYGIQRGVLQRCDCIHVTSEQEFLDVRKRGLEKPVAIIGLGTEIPCDNIARSLGREKRRVLYLGRLDPIKCIPNLIDAWNDAKFDGWELHIVGSGAPLYANFLRNKILSTENPNIMLRDAVYDAQKSKEYNCADVFVLPSSSENFSLTVIEALSHRVPVIATFGTPWKVIEDRKCGWWVSNSPTSLNQALTVAIKLSDEQRKEMGMNGLRLVREEYTWSKLSARYASLYRWVTGRGERPSFVRIAT